MALVVGGAIDALGDRPGPGFALLQWSQRERLVNLAGSPHFFDDLYMSATTLFALGIGDVMPKGRGERLLVVAETGWSLMLLTMGTVVRRSAREPAGRRSRPAMVERIDDVRRLPHDSAANHRLLEAKHQIRMRLHPVAPPVRSQQRP